MVEMGVRMKLWGRGGFFFGGGVYGNRVGMEKIMHGAWLQFILPCHSL